MNSREKILAATAANQPGLAHLPEIGFLKGNIDNVTEKFVEILKLIGGKVIEINSLDEVIAYIKQTAISGRRVVATIPELSAHAELINNYAGAPHNLQDIELAVINSALGVAENGAVWINGDELNQRALPFICQHLAVVLKKENIVATMHGAYEKIGNEKYGFSTFIAGPSKTADIEQSLVLGAHGPRTMTVFLMDNLIIYTPANPV